MLIVIIFFCFLNHRPRVAQILSMKRLMSREQTNDEAEADFEGKGSAFVLDVLPVQEGGVETNPSDNLLTDVHVARTLGLGVSSCVLPVQDGGVETNPGDNLLTDVESIERTLGLASLQRLPDESEWCLHVFGFTNTIIEDAYSTTELPSLYVGCAIMQFFKFLGSKSWPKVVKLPVKQLHSKSLLSAIPRSIA